MLDGGAVVEAIARSADRWRLGGVLDFAWSRPGSLLRVA
jgi:hypothetical protein